MNGMNCIDLKKRFGKLYRVRYKESYQAEHEPGARANDPWLKIIPCRVGHIYPWGGERLAAFQPRGPVALKLKALPGVVTWTDGDDGVTVLFDVEQFDAVAKLMQPRRRRQVSTEQREAAARRFAEYRARALVAGQERP